MDTLDPDDIEPGDFLYQADQELFLVCTENRDEEIEFSVHGWRTIDKERLESYLEADKPVIHTEEKVHDVIDESDDPDAGEKLEWLKGVFEKYSNREIEEDSAHGDFALDDT